MMRMDYVSQNKNNCGTFCALSTCTWITLLCELNQNGDRFLKKGKRKHARTFSSSVFSWLHKLAPQEYQRRKIL